MWVLVDPMPSVPKELGGTLKGIAPLTRLTPPH